MMLEQAATIVMDIHNASDAQQEEQIRWIMDNPPSGMTKLQWAIEISNGLDKVFKELDE